MTTYQQVVGFTANGAARFASFLAQHGREDLLAEDAALACLGAIEDNLNGGNVALTWELPEHDSGDSEPHTFVAGYEDLRIKAVNPGDDDAFDVDG